ncbi:hypothetical protein [Streptosporangium vulgare]|uniref:hypothetical protein n=1 Tax=Streptosporangium vulgare TaxID=46190 RepID=UPI0031D37666
MGLTPRQVARHPGHRGTGLLIVLGVVAGAVAGASLVGGLIDLQGTHQRVGAGIGRAPSVLTLAVAMLVAVGTALLVTLIPAGRAAAPRSGRRAIARNADAPGTVTVPGAYQKGSRGLRRRCRGCRSS